MHCAEVLGSGQERSRSGRSACPLVRSLPGGKSTTVANIGLAKWHTASVGRYAVIDERNGFALQRF
jgi:hypothetical protein